MDPTGFRLTSPQLVVNASAGQAVVTIEHTDTSREAQIRYLTAPGTAIRGEDYRPVKAMIDFPPGQSSAVGSGGLRSAPRWRPERRRR